MATRSLACEHSKPHWNSKMDQSALCFCSIKSQELGVDFIGKFKIAGIRRLLLFCRPDAPRHFVRLTWRGHMNVGIKCSRRSYESLLASVATLQLQEHRCTATIFAPLRLSCSGGGRRICMTGSLHRLQLQRTAFLAASFLEVVVRSTLPKAACRLWTRRSRS